MSVTPRVLVKLLKEAVTLTVDVGLAEEVIVEELEVLAVEDDEELMEEDEELFHNIKTMRTGDEKCIPRRWNKRRGRA